MQMFFRHVDLDSLTYWQLADAFADLLAAIVVHDGLFGSRFFSELTLALW